MNRGERIDLLRRTATRLSADDYPWDDMVLVLRQFGFRLADPVEWNNTAYAYVLWAIEDASDDALAELGGYLFGGAAGQTLDPANLPWESGTFRLFISHTHPNARLAGEMSQTLSRWRVDAFVAHRDIEPTREWEREIEAALSSCQALVALITADFVGSRWCDQEVGYGLAMGVPIVPVRLEADPHGFMAKFQAVTVSDPRSSSWVVDGIFRALARHSAVRADMAAPVVHRFALSGSFDGARSNFGIVQQVAADHWTRELVEIAERAARDNHQIEHATVLEPERKPMPEALSELLAPIREKLGMDEAAPLTDDDIPF